MTSRYRVLPVIRLLLVFLSFTLTNDVITITKRDGTLQEPLQSIVKPTFNVSWENNSQYQITFTAVADGSVAYALLTVENIVTWNGQQFVIKSNVPSYSGGYATVAITASHIYMECKKIFQHNKKDGTLTYSVNDVLSFYFANNKFGYSYEVKGTFPKHQISDLGSNNASDGLSQIVSTWPDTFIFPDNKKIIVYDKATFTKNLGNRLGYGYNSDNMTLTYDSTNLVNQLTVISTQKDDGSYYWQPHIVKDDKSISEYGVFDGGDFNDERFTDVNAADKAAKAQLVTEPSISITLDYLDTDVPIAGEVRRLEILDTGFITNVMVLAYSYYPLDKSQKPTVTLNSNAKTILNYQSSQKTALKKAINSQNTAVKNATKTAKTAYNSRLAGHKVVETTQSVMRLQAAQATTLPIYKLYVPNVNNDFEGLEAGDEFYPSTIPSAIEGLKDFVNNINENTNNSPLNGKIMNIIGDSYVANNGEPVENTWHYKIANANNMTYRNYGINGNCLVAEGGVGTKVYDRYDDMENNADYILVVGGKNDYNQQMAINEFSTQIASLIKRVVQKYQGKNVCFFTPWPDQGSATVNPIELHEYANAIEEQCGLLGVPCFNSSKRSGIATYNAQFRSKYFQSADDVSHLNAAGHDLFVDKAQKFLESL